MPPWKIASLTGLQARHLLKYAGKRIVGIVECPIEVVGAGSWNLVGRLSQRAGPTRKTLLRSNEWRTIARDRRFEPWIGQQVGFRFAGHQCQTSQRAGFPGNIVLLSSVRKTEFATSSAAAHYANAVSKAASMATKKSVRF